MSQEPKALKIRGVRTCLGVLIIKWSEKQVLVLKASALSLSSLLQGRSVPQSRPALAVLVSPLHLAVFINM